MPNIYALLAAKTAISATAGAANLLNFTSQLNPNETLVSPFQNYSLDGSSGIANASNSTGLSPADQIKLFFLFFLLVPIVIGCIFSSDFREMMCRATLSGMSGAATSSAFGGSAREGFISGAIGGSSNSVAMGALTAGAVSAATGHSGRDVVASAAAGAAGAYVSNSMRK